MSFNSSENNLKKSGLFNLKRWQKVALLLLFYDFTTTVFSYFAALFIRFDCVFSSIPRNYINVAVVFVPLYALVCLIIYSFFKLYKSVWHFASYSELLRLIVATFYTLILHVVSLSVYCKFIKIKRFPISYFFIGIFLQFAFMIFARFGYRFLILVRSKYHENAHTNVLLYGAGSAGQGILRDVNHTHQTEDRIVCIIDDDPIVLLEEAHLLAPHPSVERVAVHKDERGVPLARNFVVEATLIDRHIPPLASRSPACQEQKEGQKC